MGFFKCTIWKNLKNSTNEGSNAEVGQLIAGMKFRIFLTPDMASKNDGRHGIGLSSHSPIDAMSGVVF